MQRATRRPQRPPFLGICMARGAWCAAWLRFTLRRLTRCSGLGACRGPRPYAVHAVPFALGAACPSLKPMIS